MMSIIRGTKRKSESCLLFGQNSLGHEEDKDELCPHIAKKHQPLCVSISRQQYLDNDWIVSNMGRDVDHSCSNSNSMDMTYPDHSTSISPSLTDSIKFRSNFFTNTENCSNSNSLNQNETIQNYRCNASHISTSDHFMETPLSLNSCSQSVMSAMTDQLTDPISMNINHHHDLDMSLPTESRSYQSQSERCADCAAGKSGHILHIGRWKLMDSQ